MKAEVSTTNRLVKAVAVMGSGTLISRILGLLRLALILAILGSSTRQGEMFWFANLIPNTLLLFLAGGILNTVLVPQIVRAIKHDSDGGEAFVNRILTAFAVSIGAVTTVLTLASPLLLWIYVSDAWRVESLAEHYSGMLLLTYLCVPQLFFYGMFFLISQVLNAKDQFTPGMWAPIVNNIISIAVFGLYFLVWGIGDPSAAFTTGQILVLGIGSTLGIIAQFLVLLPFMKRTGFTFRFRFDLRGAGLGRTAHLAKWTIYYVIVSQLTLIVVQRLASSATPGGQGAGMTVYSSAEMLWLLPHSLITVSLATAMLSSASRLAAEDDLAGVAAETLKTIKFAVLVLVPASVLLVAFAHPLARVLLGYGAGAQGAAYIGTTLIAFSIGLVPYTIQFVCNRTYYALEDTRGAFLLQLFIAVLNAVFAIILVVPFNNPAWVAPALAASVSLAYLIGVVVTIRALKRKLPDLDVAEILRFVIRLFTFSIPAGALAFIVSVWITSAVGGRSGDLLGGVVGGLVFLAGFVGGARIFHLNELNDALRTVLRRGKNTVPTRVETETPEGLSLPVAVGESEGESSQPATEVVEELIDTSERAVAIGQADDTVSPIVESGQLLSHRYSLRDRLLRRGDTETWLAFDQVLSRLVLVHLLPTTTQRLAQVLEAARKGAVATESRFLRVLDAVECDDHELSIGGYVVCEYAPGQTLEELLQQGPLSAIEAAWVVRELADAMTTMHAQGLFHERLSPDTVLITASGNVKIIGFGVEAVLEPTSQEEASWSQRELRDVRALGRLLYAALVHRWPGGDVWGMRAAPKDQSGQYLTPRQVRQGVSPVLDAICDRMLSDQPRRGEEPISSAADLVTALNRVLGSADASSDLEYRLRYPTVHDLNRQLGSADDPPTDELPQVVMVDTDEADLPAQPLAIQPPRDSRFMSRPRPPKRRWLSVLVGLVGVTLLVSLTIIAVQNASRGTADPTPSVVPPVGRQIVAGSDFDPIGNDGENANLVPLAFDGKPDTAWTTERYRSADFGNRKTGVGVVVDLGEPKPVRMIRVMFAGQPHSIEIYMPSGENPGKKLDEWKSLGSLADAGDTAELNVTPVTTRYVLVWLTKVPAVEGGRFQGRINEIQVLG